jgi:hypothetical protein
MLCIFCERCFWRVTQGLRMMYSSGVKSYLWKWQIQFAVRIHQTYSISTLDPLGQNSNMISYNITSFSMTGFQTNSHARVPKLASVHANLNGAEVSNSKDVFIHRRGGTVVGWKRWTVLIFRYVHKGAKRHYDLHHVLYGCPYKENDSISAGRIVVKFYNEYYYQNLPKTIIFCYKSGEIHFGTNVTVFASDSKW